jgi:hypothetical protein
MEAEVKAVAHAQRGPHDQKVCEEGKDICCVTQ